MEISSNSHPERTDHEVEAKPSYKSWKKKYRKLRHRFEGVMKRSDELFKQDLIATASIKRITEENNRLLDLLLELNSNSHISKTHYQDIGSPSSATPPRLMSPETFERFKSKKFFIDGDDGDDVTMGDLTAKHEVTADTDVEPMDLDSEVPTTNLSGVDNALQDQLSSERPPTPDRANPTYNPNGVQYDPSKPFTPPIQVNPPKPRQRREITPPPEPAYVRGSTPSRFRETSPFLSPIEDEELPPGTIRHYHQQDVTLTTPIVQLPSPSSKPVTALNASQPVANATTEEEHHWPRNPMSVYCWLRKYQPQVFLQDNEAPGGKERKKKGKRGATSIGADDDEEHGVGASSPVEPKPKRGGTRISFAGGEPVETPKAAAGTKRRRPQKDEGAEETPEKEKGTGKSRGSSTKAPAAKRPRKSTGVKKEVIED